MSLVLAKTARRAGGWPAVRVVDLTQPLSPQTPLLPLPRSSTTRLHSRSGSSRATMSAVPLGIGMRLRPASNTGTHFDAPVHWVSGKDLPDNTVDRIPPKKFVGPACVIDVSAEGGRRTQTIC